MNHYLSRGSGFFFRVVINNHSNFQRMQFNEMISHLSITCDLLYYHNHGDPAVISIYIDT
jgi:hypothetical protein